MTRKKEQHGQNAIIFPKSGNYSTQITHDIFCAVKSFKSHILTKQEVNFLMYGENTKQSLCTRYYRMLQEAPEMPLT